MTTSFENKVLLAEMGARENRNLTIKRLAEEVNIVYNYFDCEVGDLLQREKAVGPKRLPRKKDEFWSDQISRKHFCIKTVVVK